MCSGNKSIDMIIEEMNKQDARLHIPNDEWALKPRCGPNGIVHDYTYVPGDKCDCYDTLPCKVPYTDPQGCCTGPGDGMGFAAVDCTCPTCVPCRCPACALKAKATDGLRRQLTPSLFKSFKLWWREWSLRDWCAKGEDAAWSFASKMDRALKAAEVLPFFVRFPLSSVFAVLVFVGLFAAVPFIGTVYLIDQKRELPERWREFKERLRADPPERP